MSQPASRKGKADPKVLGLALILAVALGGVYFSYRLTNAPRAPTRSAVLPAGSTAGGVADLDRLLLAVQTRLKEQERTVPVDWAAPVVAAASKAAPASVAREETVMKLRGVVHDGAQPLAFINEATVGLGETILGYTVKEIRADGVTLVDGQGRKHVLPLYE